MSFSVLILDCHCTVISLNVIWYRTELCCICNVKFFSCIARDASIYDPMTL